LIRSADVLVENFTLGTLDKLGLTAAHLAELNPELVIGSVNAFGITGPLKDEAGLDQVMQGVSGLMSVTGPEDGDGYRFGVPIVDITSGMVCAFGIAAALAGRAVGRSGSHVTTSLLETALNLSVFQGQRALSLGQDPAPQGNNHPTIAPYGTFATATEPLNIAVGNDKQWRALCDLLALPDAADSPRFRTGALRSSNRDELKDLIEVALATKTAAEWVPIIGAASIPCGPILTYTQAFDSPQVDALHLVYRGSRRDGSPLPLLRGPLSIDGVPSEISSVPPLLGEHTSAVLRELGFADHDIERLEHDGRVRNARDELV
jgi:CoA:oxalate CoA-transferase